LPRRQFDLPVVVDRHTGCAERSARPAAAPAMNDGSVARGAAAIQRALASALGVSRTVVTAAYEQLYAEGWLEGRHGSGTYVADIAPAGARHDRYEVVRQDRPADARPSTCGPGCPGSAPDTPAWRRAWRLAAAVSPVHAA